MKTYTNKGALLKRRNVSRKALKPAIINDIWQTYGDYCNATIKDVSLNLVKLKDYGIDGVYLLMCSNGHKSHISAYTEEDAKKEAIKRYNYPADFIFTEKDWRNDYGISTMQVGRFKFSVDYDRQDGWTFGTNIIGVSINHHSTGFRISAECMAVQWFFDNYSEIIKNF